MDIDRIIALLKEADRLQRTRALLATRSGEDTFTIGYGQEKLEFQLTQGDAAFIESNISFRMGGIKSELESLGVHLP